MEVIVAVVMLLLPGMEKPVINRIPMESFEACQAKVAEAGEGLKLHAGETYKYMVAREVTSTKSDPA